VVRRATFFQLCETLKEVRKQKTEWDYHDLWKAVHDAFQYAVNESAFRDACEAIGVTFAPKSKANGETAKPCAQESQINRLKEDVDCLYGLFTDSERLNMQRDVLNGDVIFALSAILNWIAKLDELDGALAKALETIEKHVLINLQSLINQRRAEQGLTAVEAAASEDDAIDVNAVMKSQRKLAAALHLPPSRIWTLINRGMPYEKGTQSGSVKSRAGRYSVREIIEWARVHAPELDAHWEKYGVSN
jgi:hypothetical protein